MTVMFRPDGARTLPTRGSHVARAELVWFLARCSCLLTACAVLAPCWSGAWVMLVCCLRGARRVLVRWLCGVCMVFARYKAAHAMFSGTGRAWRPAFRVSCFLTGLVCYSAVSFHTDPGWGWSEKKRQRRKRRGERKRRRRRRIIRRR